MIDDQLYVFGGFDSAAATAMTAVDVFDPSGDNWSSRMALPSPVTHIGLELDGREVWVVGGFIGDHPGVATAATWIYDVDLDSWSSGPALPKAVAGGALVRYDRNLHYFGGVEADRDTDSADHYVLDLDNTGAGWSTLAPLPSPRNHLSGVRLGNYIHAMGGQNAHDTNPLDTDLHHAYDPVLDQWSTRASLPTPRSHFEPGTMVEAGKAIIVSGKSLPLGYQGLFDVTEYDPVLDEWNQLPPLPEPGFGVSSKVIQGDLIATTGAALDLSPMEETYSRPVGFTFGGHMRVNCGGDEYVDTQGQTWCPDLGFLDGDDFENPLVADVLDTVEDELYRTFREGANGRVTYRFPANDGKYRLVLHFAEIKHGATGHGGPSVGERVLRFQVEDVQVRAGVDVADLVGVETAIQFVYDFEASGGAVDLKILAAMGHESMISAVELIDLPDNAFQNVCMSGPNSSGSPGVMGFHGSSSIASNDLLLIADSLPANQFGLFFYSQFETTLPFGNGTRCVTSPITRLDVHQVANGRLSHKLNFNNQPPGGVILLGSTWTFQAWFRDTPAGGANFDTSDALRMVFTD